MKFSVIAFMAMAAGTAEAVNYKKDDKPFGYYAGQDWLLDYKVQTEDKRQKEVQRLKEIQSETAQPPKSGFLNIFQKLNDYLVPQNKAI